MVMALVNGLPEEYNALISALDAIDEEETKLKFEFIKSRIKQEKQRIPERAKSAQENPSPPHKRCSSRGNCCFSSSIGMIYID